MRIARLAVILLALAPSGYCSGTSGTGTSTSTGTGLTNLCAGFLPYPCMPASPTTGIPVWADTLGSIPTSFIYPGAVAGTVFIEPNSGERYMWLTDPTHTCGSVPNGQTWTTTSISVLQQITQDSAYMMITTAPESSPALCAVHFTGADPPFSGFTSVSSANQMRVLGSFNHTDPHLYYGVDASNTFLVKTTDVAVDITNGSFSFTNIMDLSLTSNCPNVPSLTATSNGEISMSFDGTNLLYWGNASQDSASIFWILRKFAGVWHCMFVNMATGDENADSTWNVGGGTTCTACIPSTFRTNGANKGMHRATISLTKDPVFNEYYVIIENQNFTTSNLIFQVPAPGGAWPTTPITQCSNSSPVNCEDHQAFGFNGVMANGTGDTVGAAGNDIGQTLRAANAAGTAGTICNPFSINGYCSLLNTFTVAAGGSGCGQHFSWGGAEATLTWPLLAGIYQGGPCTSHITLPWMQELDYICPNPTQQCRYRVIKHHMKSQWGNITQNNNVSGNGTTVTVNTVSNHNFTATQSITAYNCNDATFNGTYTVASVVSTTQFTITNAYVGPTDCAFVFTAANGQEFWATTLVQAAPNGRFVVTPDNAERTFPPDSTGQLGCNGGVCPQHHMLIIETR